ncbi:hypothetical protein CYMTET_51334 [Cymbomonas tetramitiformis]|uniref:Uncharacterized protein n=1 Tax=Cymbomonas tetramitiformis TaxID=36881 RepID=A0AAE0BMS2_9CHLO|nr:hypothetical protein CYMTET_51334 [Cymbomonas tetramitiformis]
MCNKLRPYHVSNGVAALVLGQGVEVGAVHCPGGGGAGRASAGGVEVGGGPLPGGGGRRGGPLPGVGVEVARSRGGGGGGGLLPGGGEAEVVHSQWVVAGVEVAEEWGGGPITRTRAEEVGWESLAGERRRWDPLPGEAEEVEVEGDFALTGASDFYPEEHVVAEEERNVFGVVAAVGSPWKASLKIRDFRGAGGGGAFLAGAGGGAGGAAGGQEEAVVLLKAGAGGGAGARLGAGEAAVVPLWRKRERSRSAAGGRRGERWREREAEQERGWGAGGGGGGAFVAGAGGGAGVRLEEPRGGQEAVVVPLWREREAEQEVRLAGKGEVQKVFLRWEWEFHGEEQEQPQRPPLWRLPRGAAWEHPH